MSFKELGFSDWRPTTWGFVRQFVAASDHGPILAEAIASVRWDVKTRRYLARKLPRKVSLEDIQKPAPFIKDIIKMGPVGPSDGFATEDEAKTAVDALLQADGWPLDEAISE